MDEPSVAESASSVPEFLRYNEPVMVIKQWDKKGPQAELEVKEEVPIDKCQEALNKIFPPRAWEDDGQFYEQTVSSTPMSAEDLDEMLASLDTLVKQNQGRDSGVCPVRRDIFTKLFDEAIRQVTINCVERGVLLARVRDEIKMTMESFERLNTSSLVYGMGKVVEAEDTNVDLADQIRELEWDNIALKEIVEDMKADNEEWLRVNARRRGSEFLKFTEEVGLLKKTNVQLKAQLENLIAPKK